MGANGQRVEKIIFENNLFSGTSQEKEAEVTRATHMTMAWAVFLYLVVLVVAFLGKVKPFW